MSLPARRPGRALALLRAHTRATMTPGAALWPARLAGDLRELDADWRESAEVCADAAWVARAAGHGVLGLPRPAQVTAAGLPVPPPAIAHLRRCPLLLC